MRVKLSLRTIAAAFFAIASCGVVAEAQPLLIDFNSLTQDGGPHPQEGYQSYDAGHEVPADFDTKEYGAFLTEVTVTPGWPDSLGEANTMQSIDRTANHDAFWQGDKVDLLTDWLGVDTRVANGGNGDFTLEQGGEMTRLTLTLGGLPAGNYNWISYHHDTEWIHAQFFAEFSVNGGASFEVLTDVNGNNLFEMTSSNNTGGDPPAEEHYHGDVDPDPILLPSTVIWNFEKPNDDDLVVMFTPIAHTAVHTQLIGINGFELYQEATPELLCDFDGDLVCGVADINLLMNDAETGGTSTDLNGDNVVNDADRDEWLALAGPENGFAGPLLVGDSDLDGTVEAADLNAVGIAWQNESEFNWENGNFTIGGGPGVRVNDLNALGLEWQNGVPLAAASQAVPEPAGLALILVGFLGLFAAGRR